MKISDFLRMKITPDNKQFDMIKNIRFLNEKNDILVGKGTVTIKAFCDSFFDYVYRNYGNARSAEKLIKANRKKYHKFSGSESMILVQRILNEIVSEYAISNYHITCEMDNSAVKKTPVQEKAKEQNAAPVQQVPEPQNITPISPVNAPVNVQQMPVNTSGNNLNTGIPTANNKQNVTSVKIQALESELVRMQPNNNPVEIKQPEPEADVPEFVEEPQINLPQEDIAEAQVISQADQQQVSDTQVVQPEIISAQAVQQEIPQTQAVQPEVIQAQAVQQEIPQAQAFQPEIVQEQAVQQAGKQQSAQQQNTQVQPQMTQNPQNVNPAAQQKPATPDNTKKGGQEQNNGSNKKNRKDKDKRPPIEEARLRPGKGIPPIKDLKPVARFQNAAVTKSKLNLDEIPCIAVIEDNKVPTMEEVPFIGIPEDNSVPTMKEVPYVGVDEFGNPVESRSIYLQIDDNDNNGPVSDIRKEKPLAPSVEKPVKEEKDYVKPVETAPVKSVETAQIKPAETSSAKVEAPVSKSNKYTNRVYKDLKKIVANAIQTNKQVVFTGPSGTGKTFQVRRYVRGMTKGYNGFKFVQFHPGFEYSDFVEGMRPANIVNSNVPTNVRLDGVFKAFCRTIVEDNLESAIPGFSTMYSEKKQKVLQGLYEKIRDKKEDLDEGRSTEGFDHDSEEYIFENGVRDYYFIIDELNRADLTRVFGDVLFALDEDYRGIENRFDTRLSNLKSYRIVQADDIGKANYSTSHIGYAEQMKFDCFERGFFIPRNLHIIGTMNEIESSSDSIGFAFKHKFRWVYIDPEEIMFTSLRDIHKDKDIFWLDRFAENVNRINGLISDGFSSEYRLGPAYFRKLNQSKASIDEVFETTIEPLLKEYLKGQPLDITERFVSECHKALHLGI